MGYMPKLPPFVRERSTFERTVEMIRERREAKNVRLPKHRRITLKIKKLRQVARRQMPRR